MAISNGDAAKIATVANTMIEAFPKREAAIRARLADTPTLAAQQALADLKGGGEERTASANTVQANMAPMQARTGEVSGPDGFFGLSGWDGQLSLDGTMDRGEAQRDSVSAGMELTRATARWRHRVKATFDFARAAETTRRQRLLSEYDIDYDVSDGSYALARLKYKADRFSGYDYRAFSSIGYGYRLADGRYIGWQLEGGPGYRVNGLEPQDSDTSEVVGRLSSQFEWQISEFAFFKNTLGVFAGTHTSTLNMTSSLALDIASRLSGKLAFQTTTDSDRGNGGSRTNVTSTAELLFEF